MNDKYNEIHILKRHLNVFDQSRDGAFMVVLNYDFSEDLNRTTLAGYDAQFV